MQGVLEADQANPGSKPHRSELSCCRRGRGTKRQPVVGAVVGHSRIYGAGPTHDNTGSFVNGASAP